MLSKLIQKSIMKVTYIRLFLLDKEINGILTAYLDTLLFLNIDWITFLNTHIIFKYFFKNPLFMDFLRIEKVK